MISTHLNILVNLQWFPPKFLNVSENKAYFEKNVEHQHPELLKKIILLPTTCMTFGQSIQPINLMETLGYGLWSAPLILINPLSDVLQRSLERMFECELTQVIYFTKIPVWFVIKHQMSVLFSKNWTPHLKNMLGKSFSFPFSKDSEPCHYYIRFFPNF